MKQEEMKGKPLLSVALCTYNGERFLKEQLNSIAIQELPVDEIIICDDDSKDKTICIAREFKETHPELDIKIYKNEVNQGVIKNFEKAISACKGDIIFCSDQDDIWTKEKTKTIVSWFDTHQETELVFTDAKLIDKNGHPLCESTLFDNLQLTPQARKLWKQGLTLELFNIKNWVTGSTIAFKKTLAKSILPFITGYHLLHDEQIAITCIKRHSIHMMSECLTQYRIHDNNTIGVNIKKNKAPLNVYAPYEVRKSLEMVYKNNPAIVKRISFLRERNHNSKTVKGRMKTLFNIFKYIKYYKCLFIHVYLTDLTWGIDAFLSNKIDFIRSKIVQ